MRVLASGDPWFNQVVAQWVAERIPSMESAADFGPCIAFGVVDGAGEPVAGVVFHNYQPRFGGIEASFASTTPRWITRGVISEIMRYPFAQLHCLRITALTPRSAASARRFLDTFGFKREGLVRQGFGDDDAVISGLLRTEWDRSRWNTTRAKPAEESHGQERADTSRRTRSERRKRRADPVE